MDNNRSLFCTLTVLTLLTALFLTGCSVYDLEEPVPDRDSAREEKVLSPFIPGIVTVEFDEATAEKVEKALLEKSDVATRAPQLGSVMEQMGAKSLRRVFPDAGKFEERTRREGLHRFYYVEFDAETPATKAAGDLADVPGVLRVTPQLPVRSRTFNDPYFSSQWHFLNTRYAGADINVQKVWDEFTVGSSNVIVSVVDEGVFMQHVDLVDNLIPCLEDGTGSYNFNNDTPTVVPTQGHGTHVAGVISAISNNGIGVAGIAGGDAAKGIPGVKVMSCQIFDLYGNPPDIYEAIKHGADNGAVILQCSWGFSPDMDGDGFTTDEEIELYRSFTIDDLPEYKAAIDYFIKYAGCDNNGNQLADSPMKGGVVVFASGNDNFDYDPLVSYEPVIAVGAFGGTGNKASYSNYGEWVDIAAPGGDAKLGIYSTLLSNSYGGTDWQGTSMACPHVSGVAALLVSYFGGKGFTAEECRTRLIRGAVPNFFSGNRYIGRKLDAYGAFTFDLNTPLSQPALSWVGNTPASIGYNEEVEIPFSATDPAGQKVFLSLTPETEGVELLESAVKLDARKLDVGKYSFKLTATNEDRVSVSLPLSFEVRSNATPKTLASALPGGILVEAPGESTSVNVSDWFSDPDGDELSLTAEVADSEKATVSLSDNGVLTVKGVRSGRTSVTVTASDGELTAVAKVSVAVKDPALGTYVYPTAAKEEITLCVDSVEPVTVKIELFSSTGVPVLTNEREGDIFRPITLTIRDLTPGLYTARVSFAGQVHTLRFAKV